MSTTMLETYDAQMLDYQNDDFSMQVSSSDSWLQDEAVMEEEGHPENSNISIEIDMESYEDSEEHQPEYEMADGSENLDLDSTELVDVEVYDASRAHTPDALHDTETHLLRASNSIDPPQLSSDVPEPAIPNSPNLPRTELIRDNSFPGVSVPPAISPVIQLGEASPEAQSSSTITEKEITTSEIHEQTCGEDIEGENAVEEEQFEGWNKSEDIVDGGNESSVSEKSPAGTSIADVNTPTPLENGSEIKQSGTDGQGESHSTFNPLTVSTDDPHEISEGVYIDPPPAVIISFPSYDSTTISLFNIPSPPGLKSPYDGDSLPLSPTVLLGHLPTLYYEPLSSVFEALRQEEYLADIPNLLHGELVLDAYDLELVMSEDHTYALELSLHDLNVLHDGLNRPGPLRLQLRNVGPRFVDRYHILQEKVAQLNLVDSKEASAQRLSGDQPEDEVHGADAQASVGIEEHNESQNDGQEAEDNKDKEHPGDSDTADNTTRDTFREDRLHTQTISSPQPPSQAELEQLEFQSNSRDNIKREGALLAVETPDRGHADAEDYAGSREEDIDGAYGESLLDGEYSQEKAGDTLNEVPASPHEHDLETGEGSTTPRPLEPLESCPTGNDVPKDNDSHHSESVDLQDSVSNEQDSTFNDFEDIAGADAQNSNSVTNVEPEVEQTNKHVHLPTGQSDATSIFEVVDVDDTPYELEAWDDTLDGEGDLDTTWEAEELEHETDSNQSSTTLSSKSSKRSISEAELEEYENEEFSPPSTSPGPKRPRVE